MMSGYILPGMFVRHPTEPAWGLGRVQSVEGGRIIVNFEHQGKVVVDGDRIDLRVVEPNDLA